jgi:hypothetical protein
VGYRNVQDIELGKRKVLYGFACPANQSPLENFDQSLRGRKINDSIECASIAQCNADYVVAILVRRV